jgi:uncharacterized protein YbgA (DUF1722 family)
MLMEGLAVMGTRGKHVNVPQHLMGYLKNHLSLSRYPVPDWVRQQVYLHPYPKELMLRNHV